MDVDGSLLLADVPEDHPVACSGRLGQLLAMGVVPVSDWLARELLVVRDVLVEHLAPRPLVDQVGWVL